MAWFYRMPLFCLRRQNRNGSLQFPLQTYLVTPNLTTLGMDYKEFENGLTIVSFKPEEAEYVMRIIRVRSEQIAEEKAAKEAQAVEATNLTP